MEEEARAARRRTERANAEVRRQEEERILREQQIAQESTRRTAVRASREGKIRAAVFVVLIIGAIIAVLVTQ